MPLTPQELLTQLDHLQIQAQTHHHPPLRTVEESKALRGDLPGLHCKNLFLKDKKKQLWLVVAAEDRPINLKELKGKIGSAHLSFGKADLLQEVLGVSPGSVTPFSLINDVDKQVRVVLDSHMMAEPLINYHPLTNEMTTALSPEGLRQFIRHCGHEFSEVEL
ncbi:prolyl-tRNA synthetase associated domain-containing protein [Terasakiella sp. SH-1]|uniref:prolyl-tRNA synthetase associated domain-containing protein n=1 Tax=Terasakiella sp. SH-1 TaxID=2560057 RepID=UPI0010747399|nr:prolyl-tRNA synthetase associated domain-containing protein [Terasakiella sp. SH-1]